MSTSVGFYMSAKKWQKLNMSHMEQLLADRQLHMVKLDLDSDLEQQGPLAAIVHKLSEDAVKAKCGDCKSLQRLEAFENFTKSHPETTLFDPLDGLWILLDRSRQYKLIEESQIAAKGMLFTPAYVQLFNLDDSVDKIRKAGVQFPAVCKPTLAHGSSLAHQMSLVFNEDGLKDIRTPCVVQSFINHGARLYKLFVLGSKFYVVERPSIKNFRPGDIHSTIQFDAHDISKPDSSCPLNVMDTDECLAIEPSPSLFESIVTEFRDKLNLKLFGIDVIVESVTGRHAIIDMNVFPGYEGVSTFLEDLADLIANTIGDKNGLPLSKKSNNTLQSPGSQLICNSLTNCSPLEATSNETQIPDTRSTGNQDNNCNDGNSSKCQPPLVTLSMVKLVSSKSDEMNNQVDIDSGIDSCDEKKKKSKSDILTGTLIDQSSVQNGRGRLFRCRNVISNSTQVSL